MHKEIYTLEYMLAPPQMDQMMTYVTLLSSLISLMALGYIWLRKRHWFFQPSLLIFALVCLRIQLPAIRFLHWGSDYLPNPWHFVFVTQLFPLAYLAAAIPISCARDSMLREFTDRLKAQLQGPYPWPRGLTNLCFVMSILTIGVYCIYTPFRQSGVYALFTDPIQIHAARASTMESIDSRAAIYLVSWGYHIFATLLVFASAFNYFRYKYRVFQAPWIMCCLGIGFVTLAFRGSRAGLAVFALMIFAAYYCAKRRMPSKIMLGIGVFFVLAAPAYLSLAREGQEWTLEKNFEYINILILHRILEVPDHMGMLYVYDAQTTGFYGISGFRLFGQMTGSEQESMTLRIGNEYGRPGGYSNAAPIFGYYKMMGLYAIPVTVISLLFLDLFLFFLRFRSVALLPFIVLFASKAIQGSETTVTVFIMTGGFWLVPVLAYFSRVPMVSNGDALLSVSNRLPPGKRISGSG